MKNFTIKVTEHRGVCSSSRARTKTMRWSALGRIIETDFFWNDFENGSEYSLSTEVELDDSGDDPVAEWSDEDYRDMFDN